MKRRSFASLRRVLDTIFHLGDDSSSTTIRNQQKLSANHFPGTHHAGKQDGNSFSRRKKDVSHDEADHVPMGSLPPSSSSSVTFVRKVVPSSETNDELDLLGSKTDDAHHLDNHHIRLKPSISQSQLGLLVAVEERLARSAAHRHHIQHATGQISSELQIEETSMLNNNAEEPSLNNTQEAALEEKQAQRK